MLNLLVEDEINLGDMTIQLLIATGGTENVLFGLKLHEKFTDSLRP